MEDGMGVRAGDAALGHLLLRAALGLNLLMHGVSRLLSGADKFAAGLAQGFAATPLPHGLVVGFATGLPWVEAMLGLCVLAGLRLRWALAGAGLLMMALTFGVTLKQDWETAGLQLTYAAVIAALLATAGWDRYSADAWLGRRG